jgi:antitoxin ParD1/3/4
MTMHINLSPEMEGYIKGKVAGGFYGNATEVIRDAVRRMQADDARVQSFRAAVQAGDAELERGEGKPFTPELLEQVTRSALDAMHSDKAVDPDVMP